MPQDNGPTDTSGEPTNSPPAEWPTQFPHVELDALLRQIAEPNTEREDLERVVLLVGREAQRLRSTVMRLSAARLSAADEQARDIVRAAQNNADSLRVFALEMLQNRLTEADVISAAVRAAVGLESRLLDLSEAPMPNLRSVDPESTEK